MLQTWTSVCAVENTRIGHQLSSSSEKGLARTPDLGTAARRVVLTEAPGPLRSCATGDDVYLTMARLLRTPIVPGTGIRGISTSPPKYSRVSTNVEPT
jgi:hypothetical protein